MKKHTFKKMIAFVLLVAFPVNSFAGAAEFARGGEFSTNASKLAPELFLDGHDIEAKCVMILREIAKRVFAEKMDVKAIPAFIREFPNMPHDVLARMNPEDVKLDGTVLKIGYRGASGYYYVAISAEKGAGDASAISGSVQNLKLSIVPIVDPDVTGAAEGRSRGNLVHQGQWTYNRVWYAPWKGEWVLAGPKGVNDVIRSYWKNGKPQEGCTLAPEDDMENVMKVLGGFTDSSVVSDVADSIRDNGYKLYVYDLGNPAFPGGVTTHFGVRTGAVHITKNEYDRLKVLGFDHLAARLAHEVSEIDSWRKKVEQLAKNPGSDGIKLGKVKGGIEDRGKAWEEGVRAWIRKNCDEHYGGPAQILDQKYHRKGEEIEMLVLLESILKIVEPENTEVCKDNIFDMIHNTERLDVRNIPDQVAKKIQTALDHFNVPETNKRFLKALYTRISLKEAIQHMGSNDADYNRDPSHNEMKTARLIKKASIVSDAIRKVEELDGITASTILDWIEARCQSFEFFSVEDQAILSEMYNGLKTSVDRASSTVRDTTEMGSSRRTTDHGDTVGHAIGPLSGTSRVTPITLDSYSPRIAGAFKVQPNDITGVNNAVAILSSMERYGNWAHRALTKKLGTAIIPATGTNTAFSKRTQTAVETYRIGSMDALIERVNKASKSANVFFTKNSAAANLVAVDLTGGLDRLANARIFYGSRTGYFEFVEQHEPSNRIEITIVVKGRCERAARDYTPAQINTRSGLKALAEPFGGVAEGIAGLSITIVGEEDIKGAFMNNVPMDSKKRQKLQRTFVRLLKEDVQVTGSEIIDLTPQDVKEQFAIFQNIYIGGMIHKLNGRYNELAQLRDDHLQLSSLHVSTNEEQTWERLNQQMMKLEAENAEIAKQLGDLGGQYQRLISDKTELDRIAELKKRSAEGTVSVKAEDVKRILNLDVLLRRYDQEVNDYNRRLETLTEEKRTKEREIERLTADLAPLKGKVARARELTAKISAEPDKIREARQLTLRIENAQYGSAINPGTIIFNRYEVVEKKGSGGFGNVYVVKDRSTGELRAMKILSHPDNLNARVRQQQDALFQREIDNIRVLSSRHAQVPSVFESGIYAGSKYFVMTLVDGTTLQDVIKKLATEPSYLNAKQRLVLALGVANAIATVHAAGFAHRDIKPQNIMIPKNHDGTPNIPENITGAPYDAFLRYIRIIDLGNAIPSASTGGPDYDFSANANSDGGFIQGTPLFMAPEQLDSVTYGPAGSKSDTYALGVLLFQLFSNVYPVGGEIRDPKLADMLAAIGSSNDQLISGGNCLRDAIASMNDKRLAARGNRLDVDSNSIDSIRTGLFADISSETDKRYRLIADKPRRQRGSDRWVREVMNEKELRKRLGHYNKVTLKEKEAIVALLINDYPEVDGFIEALVNQMLRKDSAMRPTVDDVAREIKLHLEGNTDRMKYRPRNEKPKRAPMSRTAKIAVGTVLGGVVLGGLGYGCYNLYSSVARKNAEPGKNVPTPGESALLGLTDPASGETRLKEIDEDLKILNANLAKEKNPVMIKTLKAAIQEAENKKAAVQKWIIEDKKKRPGVSSTRRFELDGNEVVISYPERPYARDLFQPGIANDVENAPDHRLINAVIRVAIEGGLCDVGENVTRLISLSNRAPKDFKELYDGFNEDERRRVLEIFTGELRSNGVNVTDGAISALFEHGMLRLSNMSGHAGILRDMVYVAAGAPELDKLISHEQLELKLHLDELSRWTIQENGIEFSRNGITARAIIKVFRERREYNDFALRAHQEAQKEYPVSRVSEPGVPAGQDTEPDLTGLFERPIASTPEPVEPIFHLPIFLDAVANVASDPLTVASTDDISALTATEGASGKGLILFAEDILKSSAVFDLEKLASLSGKDNSLVSKVVLFAEDAKSAEAVEGILRKGNADLNIIVITADDLRKLFGRELNTMPRELAVIRYTMNNSVTGGAMFSDPLQILGIVRGSTRDGENIEKTKDALRRSQVKAPVVCFEDSADGNVYSVIQAVSRLAGIMTTRLGQGTTPQELLFVILPPIVRNFVSRDYETFKTMVRAIGVAA